MNTKVCILAVLMALCSATVAARNNHGHDDHNRQYTYTVRGSGHQHEGGHERHDRDRHDDRHNYGHQDSHRGYHSSGLHVFFNGMLLADVSCNHFHELGFGYATDGSHVWFNGNKVKGAHAHSFRVLRNGYATDGHHNYYLGRRLR